MGHVYNLKDILKLKLLAFWRKETPFIDQKCTYEEVTKNFGRHLGDVSAEFVVGVPLTPIVSTPRYVWSNTQLVVLPLFLSTLQRWLTSLGTAISAHCKPLARFAF